jgi:hypothetical protein
LGEVQGALLILKVFTFKKLLTLKSLVYMTQVLRNLEYFNEDDYEKFSCKVFPDGIPEEIKYNQAQ